MTDMSPERFAQVRELFNELFGESPALRQERLDAVARTDAELSEAAGRLLERADLKDRIAELGKGIGPPWRQDEKLSAMVAWLALSARRP